MRDLEKYYGVKLGRRLSLARFLKRSSQYRAKQTTDTILREVNALFVKGNYQQCFGLLENAVKLVRSDPRPFYTLGLLHEEMGNMKKAQTSYFMCALLKKGDCSLWKKVLTLSAATNDDKRQAIALERICRREPSQQLLCWKMECFKRLNRKFWVISSEIELFDYLGVHEAVFDKFCETHHSVTIRRITDRLMKCIAKNEDARTEYFIRNTILNLYKIRDWHSIMTLLNGYYADVSSEFNSEIFLIKKLTMIHIGKESRAEERNALENSLSAHGRGLSAKHSDKNSPIFDVEGLQDVFSGLEENVIGQLSGNLKDFLNHCNEDSEESTVMREMAEGSSAYDEAQEAAEGSAALSVHCGCANIQDLMEEVMNNSLFWERLQDTRYVFDAAEFLAQEGLPILSISLLEKLYSRDGSLAIKIMIADLHSVAGNISEARKAYQEIILRDPTNMRVKSSLHEIYRYII